ncbi:hypothetical protein [Alishewanella sp. HL-SH06]|uniref:hypothetical protein n=1 Tax=Alishewanella sp. HL-SH06 TaxID=3461144 RepID=UPI004042A594
MDISYFRENLSTIVKKMNKLLSEGEALFSKQRIELNVEECFYTDNHFSEADRKVCKETLLKYKDQLTLERTFYENFHRTYLNEVDAHLSSLSEKNRALFWEELFSSLLRKQEIRLKINSSKVIAIETVVDILDLIGEHSASFSIAEDEIRFTSNIVQAKYENLIKIVDENLELQYQLGQLQRSVNA